jgi:hypothetical protein
MRVYKSRFGVSLAVFAVAVYGVVSADDVSDIKEIGFSKVATGKLGLPDNRIRVLLDGAQVFPVGGEKYIIVGSPNNEDYKFSDNSVAGQGDHWSETCSISIFDGSTGKMVTQQFPDKSGVLSPASPDVPGSMDGGFLMCEKISAIKFISIGGALKALVSAEGDPNGMAPQASRELKGKLAPPKKIEIIYPFDLGVDSMTLKVDAVSYKAMFSPGSPYLLMYGTGKRMGVNDLYKYLKSVSVYK